jgi:hypothetical protein
VRVVLAEGVVLVETVLVEVVQHELLQVEALHLLDELLADELLEVHPVAFCGVLLFQRFLLSAV